MVRPEIEESDPASPAHQVRVWFNTLESLGEFVGIRFGRVCRLNGKVHWFYLSHKDFDGIGGLAHLLRERGAELPHLPKITHPYDESWLHFFRFLPTLLASRKVLAWNSLKQGREIETTLQPAPAVAYHVFDEAKTTRIRRSSRIAEVTVNSLLMKYLDRAVRPALADPASAIPWMVPVNLRGKVAQGEDTGNHSSYVGIQILAADSAKQVHQRIYGALRKGQHMAAWKGFTATRLTNPEIKMRMIETSRATSQWSVGAFSNLGVWDPEKEITAHECLGDWLFAPPCLRFQMIGAGCITFRGRMTLTLQIHPELTTSPQVANEWLRSWVREIEFGLPDHPVSQT
jgi:hypothetical protein